AVPLGAGLHARRLGAVDRIPRPVSRGRTRTRRRARRTGGRRAARGRRRRPRPARRRPPVNAPGTKSTKPLSGWRVLVPRGGKWGDSVAAALRGYGGIPVIAPLINFASSDDPTTLANALHELQDGQFAWLVVTSATTVDVLNGQRSEERRVGK